jgi:hypothetical protein
MCLLLGRPESSGRRVRSYPQSPSSPRLPRSRSPRGWTVDQCSETSILPHIINQSIRTLGPVALNIVWQIVVRGGFPCGPHRSAGGFGRKIMAIIVSDTWRIKNTPIHVCGKTAFVGWTSAKCRRISSFHNLLSYNHYLREYFKLMYRKNVVTVILTAAMFLIFICMHFLVWGSLLMWSACEPTAYEAVYDCRSLRNTVLEV